MAPATDFQINLFAENLPSSEEIRRLSDVVNSSERNRLAFEAQLEASMSRTSPKALLASGIGLFILGKDGAAIEKLRKAADCEEKYLYLAFALRRTGDYQQAIENLQTSLKHGADPLAITLEKAATYRSASKLEAAAKELQGCANLQNVSAEYHYQLARLQEAQGLYDKAISNYKAAIELSPNHQRALFHLAYRCDLMGNERAAVEYYKAIVSASPVYISALINLAVIYEDAGKYDIASMCVDKILEYHPNHKRAMLFKKDIESSKTMYYDEEKEKKKTHKNQLLETPISDFELSVRSRNCLKKMNIDTIGDLLNISEAELLSYKNFGETSLREIKVILESKGLHLGMALEENEITEEQPEEDTESVAQDEAILSKPVDDLQLSVRARKCLQKLNIHTIAELIHKTDAELLGCKNFGVTSLNEIKKAISSFGLSLRNLD
jgi:DNA-directed RNA polymerase subunit alpha